MLNPILSMERVQVQREIADLKRIKGYLTQDDINEKIESLESYLKHTKPKSKNLFKICLGLDIDVV